LVLLVALLQTGFDTEASRDPACKGNVLLTLLLTAQT
jgi:hypothetical protein